MDVAQKCNINRAHNLKQRQQLLNQPPNPTTLGSRIYSPSMAPLPRTPRPDPVIRPDKPPARKHGIITIRQPLDQLSAHIGSVSPPPIPAAIVRAERVAERARRRRQERRRERARGAFRKERHARVEAEGEVREHGAVEAALVVQRRVRRRGRRRLGGRRGLLLLLWRGWLREFGRRRW
jgi:hypothetical protein